MALCVTVVSRDNIFLLFHIPESGLLLLSPAFGWELRQSSFHDSKHESCCVETCPCSQCSHLASSWMCSIEVTDRKMCSLSLCTVKYKTWYMSLR